ncbi:Protein DYAD [Glycine soja]|uniref:Protein DYAD n=2 Tax=Glycine subgen. Soja TaxID=1462606 RepID=A0A0R0JYE7_SOYBN|nr:Protein DYAD [Glycine soja]
MGIMEYWLESANLDEIHQETGVQDPYWIPPSTFGAGGVPTENIDYIGELKILKIEMAQMKKDMQELISKKQEKSEMCLMELYILTGMHENMLIWKTKVEQQLMEITNKLSDVRKLREDTTLSYPPDWLESTNIDNIQGKELAPWFGNPELLNVPQEVVLQDLNSSLPTQLHRNQPNVTPDSSMTVNAKSDLDNSLTLYQEMFLELFTRDKMEQQLLEISNTVYDMLTMK